MPDETVKEEKQPEEKTPSNGLKSIIKESKEKERIRRLTTKEIVSSSQKIHDEFDENYWKKDDKERASYHNWRHIQSVSGAAMSLLDKAESKGIDPTDILKSLENWNKIYKSDINLEELREVLKIDIAVHDLGNVAKEVEIEDGEVAVKFHENGLYRAKGAEDRSIAMVEKFIDAWDMPEDKQEKREDFKRLAAYLIDQTKFGVESGDIPFATFIEVCDQIGGNVWSDYDHHTGLLTEWLYEFPEKLVSEKFVKDFIHQRLETLVRDNTKQEQIKKIWQEAGRPFPERQEYDDNLMPVKEFLSSSWQSN